MSEELEKEEIHEEEEKITPPRNKRALTYSIVQIAIAVLAVLVFVILALAGEDVGKWSGTMIIAAMLLINGIMTLKMVS